VQRVEERRVLREREFNRFFIEALDESLGSVLGETVRLTVYDALEKHCSIARNQIPERPDDFALALERCFGVAPSKTIGKVIAKRLYFKLELVFVDEAGWRLPDYVREAKRKMNGVRMLNDQGTRELPEERQLLDRLLSSEVKADLLALFHSNPRLVDSIEGVARRIGRTASEIEADVKDLIDLGVLVKERFGKLDAVSFDTNINKQIQEIISNQLKRGAD
jgi:hypothetical protein